MEGDLVRYSRAGDVFHYRWAARRCLQMVYPKSKLQYIVIEGSSESELAGEYVIDVAEYFNSDEDDFNEIAYFQLKHTTVRKEQPFQLSDLKGTITGFSERYSELYGKDSTSKFSKISFTIVTNRPIAENFKQNLHAISKGSKVDSRFENTLKEYTKLSIDDLRIFCTMVSFADGEGDYDAQRHELQSEISQILAGTIDNPIIDSITALVQKKALPNSNGRIIREEILKVFGVTSDRALYPAPPEFEEIDNAIVRSQHDTLLNCILNASTPIIIHAAGGVGKSVFACQMAQSLPIGSLGIVYDCFGGGGYRNRSETRHRHRDALVQIANQLATYGLCDPIIAPSSALDDEILRKFLRHLSVAVNSLRKTTDKAIIAIFIDAADNAEMAAKEYSQPCFISELLREHLVDGSRLIALCRTERIHLLKPSSEILQVELKPFNVEETLLHLQRRFPEATEIDSVEFYRLTNNGNPRVQANALSLSLSTIAETLASLGPSGTTVDEQIEAQLESAILKVKDKFPSDYQGRFDAICVGLSTLPPFIPLRVLATVAEVDEETVKSFIADLGRPLWLSDTSVQFRDEPTEFWFRKTFSATATQVSSYVALLQPLAYQYRYIAESLPFLLLQAERYTDLINLALSDDFLPKDNPIDERNIRVYRLQFAFKAALKEQRYDDAVKLALRAGEEVAGNERQRELLAKNIDLIQPLQDEQRVQELAFRRMLRSGWDGSENLYSAALLSSVEGYKGEARGYLRAAINWLHLYFDERKNSKGNSYIEKLKDEDIVEFVFTIYNLHGASKAIEYLLSWTPKNLTFRIGQKIIRRIIDAGKFDVIDEILQLDSINQYLMIAIALELLEVGRFPSSPYIERCLKSLSTKRTRIPLPVLSYNDNTASAIISFIEACAARNMPIKRILKILNSYFPIQASSSVSSDVQDKDRNIYLRAVALRCVLSGTHETNLEDLLPKELVEKEKNYRVEQDICEFKEIMSGLLPWYIMRARVITNNLSDLCNEAKEANDKSNKARSQRWRDFDTIPFEISLVCLEILTLYRNENDSKQIQRFYDEYIKDNRKIRIQDRLRVVRSAMRLEHLSGVRNQLEHSAYDIVASASDEGPETKASWYVDLARAVLPKSRDDAAAYFDLGVEAVSKFGDEIVERWNAITSLASRCSESSTTSPEIAYRFIRCAELVGENVAREKYIDRNGAIKICARLSPESALAALSRWRDRDVGLFHELLPALAYELVKSNFISSSAGWALLPFFRDHGIEDFTLLCIGREPSFALQQYILEGAIRHLRLHEAPKKSWDNLKSIAEQYSIVNMELDEIIAFYAANPEKAERNQMDVPSDSPETVDYNKVFEGLELTSSSGISQGIKRFRKIQTSYRQRDEFWPELFARVEVQKVNDFLNSLVEVDIGAYHLEDALSSIPECWLRKVSVKRNWPKIYKSIGRHFALYFAAFGFKHFLRNIQASKEATEALQIGILDGLSGNEDLVSASTFFGFVNIASAFITQEQALDLLVFGLNRFEMHINEEEFADGRWSNWLEPPDSTNRAFAGLIWSALGSPWSETRWKAAHCVRKLAEANCITEINSLIAWLEKDIVGAFGSNKFPFYNLHARLYLLIALARVSIDFPHILKRHKDIFTFHALENISHILINKFAAEIALNIENAFPKTYAEDALEQLKAVCKSQLAVKKLKGYNEQLKSYWHEKGEVNTSLKFDYAYDFDRYWFEPLGNVFGISSKAVKELAAEVVVTEWDIKTSPSYKSDPRYELWRSRRHERATWHDHSSYPRVDDYRFYLSYHAMLVVAEKLLQKMPVVNRGDCDYDAWDGWLHRHLLIRNDGRWLADRRDPAPLKIPEWVQENKTKEWRFAILTHDFLNTMFTELNGELWLNVSGWWYEGDYYGYERIRVSSALVCPRASQSLLNALSTCPDPHDFKLPDYLEERMEFEIYPFVLKGWIWDMNKGSGIDEYDPLAGDIDYPSYQLGQAIIDQFGLVADAEQRKWLLPHANNPSLQCDIWSTGKLGLDEDPYRHGKRLSASFTFLQSLCKIMKSDIVFEVQISRSFKRNSGMGEEDDGYKPPQHRIYILSADGKFRDTTTNYQLR